MKKGGLKEFFSVKKYSEAYGKLFFTLNTLSMKIHFKKLVEFDYDRQIIMNINLIFRTLSNWSEELLHLGSFDEKLKLQLFTNILGSLSNWIIKLEEHYQKKILEKKGNPSSSGNLILISTQYRIYRRIRILSRKAVYFSLEYFYIF